MTRSNIAAMVDHLHRACVAYRRSHTKMPNPGPWKVSDFPPNDKERAAYAELERIGRQLYAEGGDQLMCRIYDLAVEKFGYRGVHGARIAWSGVGAWLA